jgi:hypothetical protein
LEKWDGIEYINTEKLSEVLALAMWDLAESKLNNFSDAKDCIASLKNTKNQIKRKFPKISNWYKLDWKLKAGCPGDIEVSTTVKAPRDTSDQRCLNRLNALDQIGKILDSISESAKKGVLECTRGSSSAVVEDIKKEYSGPVFCCSVSWGAGLMEHTPFLKAVIGYRYICFPDRERLGRSGWYGSERVLASYGVQAIYTEDGEGKDALGRSNESLRFDSSEDLVGIVLIPGWASSWYRSRVFKNISIVTDLNEAEKIQCTYSFEAGDDVRLEHFLLEARSRGIIDFVKILPIKVGTKSILWRRVGNRIKGEEVRKWNTLWSNKADVVKFSAPDRKNGFSAPGFDE